MSTSNDIKPGDVVELASGGMSMTVGQLLENGTSAECYWFRSWGAEAKLRDLEKSIFPLDALVKGK